MSERLVYALESFIAAASRHTFSRDLPDYCDLRTIIRLTEEDRIRRPETEAPYIFSTRDGHYVSVLSVEGAFTEFDEDVDGLEQSLETWVDTLATALNAEFGRPGHKISMVYERDPAQGQAEIDHLLTPQYQSIRRLGLNIRDVLDEKSRKLAPWIARERCWLVIWTSRASLSSAEIRDEQARIVAMNKQIPPARYGQIPTLSSLVSLKIRHDAFLEMLEHTLFNSGRGLMIRLLDAHEAGHDIRAQVDREGTSPEWYPLLPDDHITPHGDRKGDDHTPFLAPWLNYQLMSEAPETKGNLVRVGQTWHGSLSMVIGPQQRQSFTRLLSHIPRGLPFRIRTDIAPGGMRKLGMTKTALTFLAVFPALRPVWDCVCRLEQADRQDPVTITTITTSTWGRSEEEVNRNLTLLQKAFQSWGVCEMTSQTGDPYRVWTSTILAASATSGPNLLYPPLSEVLGMLPLNRAATPWAGDGNIPFITLDGKLCPVRLGTSKQNKHTTLITGDSGFGKSVLLNVLNEITITSAQTALPFIGIVDKGFSAQGLIQMIRDALPAHRKDEAVGIILQNHEDFCRNPFDVQLGARKPVIPEKEWLLNLLYALCIDPTTGEAPNARDTRQILNRITDEAYRATAETQPRLYTAGVLEDVDRALEETGLLMKYDSEWFATAPWYDIRDILFRAGRTHEAQSAQYQAVPELADLQHWLNHEDVQAAFGTVTRDGSAEKLLNYIARCLTQAASEFRMLNGRTRWALNPASRVVAIDLNNCMGDKTAAGYLKTGIMYLFAGQVTGGHFILPQYRDDLLSTVDPMFHSLHLARLDQLDQELKTKIYDEVHNARGVPFIFSALETNDREQRKFGICTMLSTQFLPDIPPDILKSANSLFLMQARPEDMPLLKAHFDVPDVTLRRFMREGKGAAPDGSGTAFLGVFRTKQATTARILKNTLGPLELWALNSSPTDSALRRTLCEDLPGETVRQLLAENFPQGSAEKIIEYRRRKAGENDAGNIIRQLAAELIEKRGYAL